MKSSVDIFNFKNLLVKGCEIPNYHGDGYCDDENNNEACLFDGGDCCESTVNTGVLNTVYCTECLCLDEGGNSSEGTTTSSGSTTSGGCSGNLEWIGDIFCDDINNNVECNFDDGDCCGPNVFTDYCDECLCLE